MHLPAVPAACAHLDLAQVSCVLAKHYGDIPASARELNIPTPDLRRLTWSRPKLLEEAELARMGVIARAWGRLIEALDSDDPRRQMWAADKIMSSWLARDHRLRPPSAARRANPALSYFAGRTRALAADELERDGRTLAVPRYGDDRVSLDSGGRMTTVTTIWPVESALRPYRQLATPEMRLVHRAGEVRLRNL